MKSIKEYFINNYGLTALSIPSGSKLLDVVNCNDSLFVCVEEYSNDYFKYQVEIFVAETVQIIPYDTSKHIRSVRIKNETLHVYQIGETK